MSLSHRIAVVALLSAVPLTGFAQAPGPDAACPATLPKVREGCGCEPREEAAFNLLAQTRIGSDNLRSRVKDCFKLDGKVGIDRLKVKGDVALNGCLSQVVDQFPEYRKTLAELVTAAKDVPAKKLDIWLTCYGKALGQGSGATTRPAGTAPAKASVAPKPVTREGIDQTVEAKDRADVTTGTMTVEGSGKGTSIHQGVKADGNSKVHVEGMTIHNTP